MKYPRLYIAILALLLFALACTRSVPKPRITPDPIAASAPMVLRFGMERREAVQMQGFKWVEGRLK